MTSSRELARVAALRVQFARDASDVVVGIGDDAAVLAGGLVWTVDAQVDGTHFRTDWATWEDIGFRSFMAAASDLAAMGAAPAFALSSLVLAPSVDDAALAALARGQAAAADQIGAPVVGGNLARGSETSITTTLLGRATKAVLRSGARPGDGLWLAGPVGLAGAGLLLLQVGPAASVQGASMHVARCLEAWRRPIARIADGSALARAAHAAIDVSDGLAHDAWQLAEASDVRIVLDADAILSAAGEPLVHTAAALGRAALDLALYGGEDYALLAAADSPLPGFVRIGTVEAAAPGSRLLMTAAGRTSAIDPRGFDHFSNGNR